MRQRADTDAPLAGPVRPLGRSDGEVLGPPHRNLHHEPELAHGP
jgi:hypothetical protein